MMLTLAACGKKPNDVDAPLGTPQGTYPRTYPDSSLDPQ